MPTSLKRIGALLRRRDALSLRNDRDSLTITNHRDFIEGSLDVLGDVCQELGMPALLCYGVTERNGGRDEARRGLGENRRFLEANDRPLVRGAVGVHAGFTVSDRTLREAGQLAA